MKLFVPEIGTRLKLTADWTFSLYDESRNVPMHEFQTGKKWTWDYRRNDPPIPVTLPAGAVLIVDRIYIRNGASDFSSLTFRALLSKDKKSFKAPFGKAGVRFWAKLAEVNTIEYDIEEENQE
jgi:hypothetical protein